MAFFATTLLTFVLALLAFPPGAGLLVRGCDGVHARPDDGTSRPGSPAHDRACRTDYGPNEASLKHYGASQNGRQGSGAAKCSGHEPHLARSW